MTKLARRQLVVPDHDVFPEYVETLGPAVADLCASAGFAPDPQQEHALDVIFAIGSAGLSAAFSVALISCRQNLKTGCLKQTALGWVFVTEEPLVVWSAHEMDTTRDAMRELVTLIENAPFLSKHLPATVNRGIYEGKTEERIELADGRRIKFKARTRTGGRGLSANKVILDEAFALQPSMTGSLLPTMGAKPDPQVIYASSAGMEDSLVVKDVRDRGRKGTSPRLAYLEWGSEKEPCAPSGRHVCAHPKSEADPDYAGCALNRESLWRKANPTLTTGRMTIEPIAGLRQELTAEEFARECLGWWDDDEGASWTVFAEAAFKGAGRKPRSLSRYGTPSLAIAASPDLSHGAIGAAVMGENGRVWGKVLAHGPGITWLVDTAARFHEKHGSNIIVDKGGPCSSLIVPLEDAGVTLEQVGLGFVADASAALYTDVVEKGRFRHTGDLELIEAARVAQWRKVGDRRVLGRGLAEISALEAVALAAHDARSNDYDVMDSVQ